MMLHRSLRKLLEIADSPIQRKEFTNYTRFLVRYGTSSPITLLKLDFLRQQDRRSLDKRYLKLLNSRFADHDVVDNHAKPMKEEFSLPVEINLNPQAATLSEISLATRHLNLKNNLIWDMRFEDMEDTLSLHRFGWILPILAEFPSGSNLWELMKIISNWIDERSLVKEGFGWDSYSISERVTNWTIFLSIIKKLGKDADSFVLKTYSSIKDQLSVLASNLEFRGSSTNNHLINNGRALFIAGSILGMDRVVSLGREILTHEIRNMFTPSGFLREGSSHYHLLICRSYLEALWFAMATGQKKFGGEIWDSVRGIFAYSRFLLGCGKLPLIGDVSPDFRPDFHLGVTEVGSRIFGEIERPSCRSLRGWHSLFIETKDPVRSDISKQNDFFSRAGKIVSYPDSGCYKYENRYYMFFLYVNPLGYVPQWSHGHSDLGGFVFHWKESPVLVDVGRPTYKKTTLGQYSRSVRAHNSISIDGYEPYVTHGLNGFAQVMIRDYFQRPPQVTIEESSDFSRIRVELYGYQRINRTLVIERIFDLYRKEMIIHDSIKGAGNHIVETFFHLSPDVLINRVDGEDLVFETASGDRLNLKPVFNVPSKMRVYKGKNEKKPAGWFFPRYGVEIPTNTLVFSQAAEIPFKNSFNFSGI